MNWGEIKAAVKAYTHRTDLDGLFPFFLAAAEQRIYYGEASAPALRLQAMLCSKTVMPPNRPADFLSATLVHEAGEPGRVLDYIAPASLESSRNAYSWNGSSLALSPHLDCAVTLHYYAKFPTPQADTDTNWLMQNAPTVYLSALLVEVARWSRDEAMGAREAANYASAVASLQSADKASRYAGARLNTRMPR